MRKLLNWMGQPKNMVKSWIIVLWAAAIYKMGYDNALSDRDQELYTKQFIQARQVVERTVDDKIQRVKNAKKQISLFQKN